MVRKSCFVVKIICLVASIFGDIFMLKIIVADSL